MHEIVPSINLVKPPQLTEANVLCHKTREVGIKSSIKSKSKSPILKVFGGAFEDLSTAGPATHNIYVKGIIKHVLVIGCNEIDKINASLYGKQTNEQIHSNFVQNVSSKNSQTRLLG
uniref:Uncharacterized protein n=1 Tax=Glossina austeni TaxID=7395 RepID=A0A1A9UGP1_GLOAU